MLLCLLCLLVKAQDDSTWRTNEERDSLTLGSNTNEPAATFEADTTHWEDRHHKHLRPEVPMVLTHRDSVRLFWKPDAMRAVWMGAIIPGYGQIYNRSYWKLPIVYGAFAGCAYAITYTNGQYQDYKRAYRDILTDKEISNDPSKSYIAILPEGYTLDRVGGAAQWTQSLKTKQNNFRRYRDISIAATVVVYALSLIDAYVDAQLFDYDISPDLSMSIEPHTYRDVFENKSTGMQLALHF